MEQNIELTREDFMSFFREDDKLNLLTVDDRIEVFLSILVGSSDIDKKLINRLLIDYNVHDLMLIEVE